MKVCLLCGETYSDPIDFCFRDGEVLASGEARQTPSARARTESYTATPGIVTAAAMVADDEPEVTRANRRALMRAAAAAYVVTDPAPARDMDPGTNGAEGGPTPLLVSPLDQGMTDAPWPLDEELPEEVEPPRSSMFAAALIGALVVVAAALGAGLIVLIGLGQREDVPTTGALPVPTTQTTRTESTSRREIEPPAYDVAPTPRPVVQAGRRSGPGNRTEDPHPIAAASMPQEPPASEFRIVLGDAGTNGPQPLVLYVDGVRAGPIPVTVQLTPGEHTFRLATEPGGGAMFEVRRIVESPDDPEEPQIIDLSE